MKLHLPSVLFKALIASFSIAYVSPPLSAEVVVTDASRTTYNDFAQNKGRYVVGGNVNALLSSIRDEVGVQVEYVNGHDPVTIISGSIMPDFSAAGQPSYPSHLVGYSTTVTVNHNGAISPVFQGGVGSRYTAIEYRGSAQFCHDHPRLDYKATRLSRLVTDVDVMPCYTGNVKSLSGMTVVHCGSGAQWVYDRETGQQYNVAGGYAYNNGGMSTINSISTVYQYSNACLVYLTMQPVSEKVPLPWVGTSGDSGSSCLVWNPSNKRYEYVGSVQSIAAESSSAADQWTTANGDGTWHETITEKYTQKNSWAWAGNYTLGTAIMEGARVSDSSGHSGTPRYSVFSNEWGDENLGRLYRNEAGINTWMDLSARRDLNDWWKYDSSYLNAGNAPAAGATTIADLHETRNSRFMLGGGSFTWTLSETVDTGIGYIELTHDTSNAWGGPTSNVVFKSDSSGNGLLNTAGYVVNKNVTLHLQFTNPEDYMREWRKTGVGDLYIEGSGDNWILLNVGGTGKTYLNRSNGFAAYNVLANTGSTVVIRDINQIARDFTFGSGGSKLDLNGNSMEWNNSAAVSADGFSIHALTEEGVITNGSSKDVTLTVKDGGASYLGSFADQEGKGALRLVYDAAGTIWNLSCIHTDLSHNSGSSFTVKDGTVALLGTITKHGTWSDPDVKGKVLVNEDDWHYADAAMDVQVLENGVFRLGSHARLTGDVTVEAGGQFILSEGVRHRMEYVEGSIHAEDTEKYSAFFGLKGDLINNGSVRVEYSAGTDADNNSYAGRISGNGSMVFALGSDGAVFTLTGDNESTGSFVVESGAVVVRDFGNGSWKLGAQGILSASESLETALSKLTADSVGVLALTEDVSTILDLSASPHVIIGALSGREVHYGTDQTSETLLAHEGQWVLGGGGGSLIVDFRLADKNATLVLGNEYGKGSVTLTNRGNSIGGIAFVGGVTLENVSLETLGGATIELSYINRIEGVSGIESCLSATSDGVLLVDGMSSLDLTDCSSVTIGLKEDGVYGDAITLAEGAAYRFGGSSAVLTLETALAAGHDLVVDAQTYEGAVLRLTNGESSLNGAVTVQGCDSALTASTEGSATLQLGSSGLLDNTTSVTLLTNSTLDVNGTNQVLHNLTLERGAALLDTAAEKGEVTMTGSLVLNGRVELNSLVISGEGTQAVWDVASFAVPNIRVKDGASLVRGTSALPGNVTLENGGTLMSSLNSIGISLTAEGRGNVLSFSAETVSLGGILNVADGGNLSLQGNIFNLGLTSYNTGADAGTLRVEAARVNLSNGAGTRIGGTLEVGSGNTLVLHSSGSTNNMVRDLGGVHLEAGANLNLEAESWNTIWNIHALSGSGNLNWTANTNHWYSSRLVLDGDNSDFTGNINVTRIGGTSGNRNFQTFVELAHEAAAANATLTINGAAANRQTALAVNTERAVIGGLNGNQSSVLYAGAALAGDSANELALSTVSSTLSTVLTIGGNGGVFAGQVKGGSDGAGISLVMDGKSDTSSQTFSGSSAEWKDVTVNRGSLVLNSATQSIGGDVTVNNGGLVLNSSALGIGGDITVNSGTLELNASSLSIDGGIAVNGGSLRLYKGQQMNLAGEVALNGGTLRLEDGLAAGKNIAVQVGDATLSGKVNTEVTVGSGVSLSLTDATVSANMYNGGSIALGSNVTFDISADRLFESTGAFYVIQGTDGSSLTGNTDAVSILIDGTALSSFAKGSTVTTDGGSLLLSLSGRKLTYAAPSNKSDQNHWDATGKTIWTVDETGAADRVYGFDDVEFAGAGYMMGGIARVWLDADQTVRNAVISASKYTFLDSSKTHTWTVGETMTISGSTISMSVMLKVLGDLNVSGENVVFNSGVTVGGDLSIVGSTAFGGGTVSVGGHIKLMGDTGTINLSNLDGVVRIDSELKSKPGTEWGLLKSLGGTVVFEKDVALKYYRENADNVRASATATFNGMTELGEVALEVGRLNVGATGQLSSDEVVLKSGTVLNVNGKADIENLTGCGSVNVSGSLGLGTALLSDGAKLTIDENGQLRATTMTLESGAVMNINGTANVGTMTNDGIVYVNGSLTVGTAVLSDVTKLIVSETGQLHFATAMVESGTELQLSGEAEVETLENSGAVSVTGTLEVGSTVMHEDTTLTVAESAQMHSAEATLGTGSVVNVQGSLEVGTATICEGASLVAQDNEGQTVYTVTAAHAGEDGSVTGACFSSAAVEGGTLENVTIDLVGGAVVELSDLMLASSSFLTDDTATVLAQGLKIEVSAQNSNASVTQMLSDVELTQTASTTTTTVSGGTDVYTLVLNNIDSVLISGDTLEYVLTDEALKNAALSGYDWVALTLSDNLTHNGELVPQAVMDTENLHVTLTLNATTYDGYYNAADGSATGTVYFRVGEQQTPPTPPAPEETPEPTTTTLSLLALAALASRRRRRRN